MDGGQIDLNLFSPELQTCSIIHMDTQFDDFNTGHTDAFFGSLLQACQDWEEDVALVQVCQNA